MEDPARLLAEIVEQMHAVLDTAPGSSAPPLHEAVQEVVADYRVPVLVANQTGQLVAASQQALHLLGHTLQTLRELNVTELAAPQDEDDVETLWETFLRQRRQTGHFALRRRDGGVVHTHYAAVTNTVGGLSVVVHVV